ncbi:hypothetical protein [Magnetospirillum moscoviense]|uniref:Uncharacterized protein n=1 Tax=Magnetospirillum moscoviense TaxID=1437059 RepID=A0A178MXR2_9PROT|nr:hypothetical protein [Magnetospirillum moscoviense]MBF0324761.1 hypothetical protein [Alphaproteobacteria bacterium]OAN56887.1 hypothetical protein A6A05_07915 [Magnetospirillum moscoviense]
MRFALAALIVAGLATPALAQQYPPPGERLVMNPPAGWAAVPVQKGEKMSITRLFPPGEDDKNWNELITVQVYTAHDQSPRTFIDSVIQYSRDNCEAAGASAVTEVPTNGYPMAVVSVTCTKGRKSGMGGFVLVQAIRGREALYVVQRQWRGLPFAKDQTPPFPDGLLRRWSEFSHQVSLCDTRDNRYPCPKQ